MQPIRYFDRHANTIKEEDVYGEKWLRLAYENPLGRLALHAFVKRPFFSRLYGRKMDAPESRELIEPFIEKYQLDFHELSSNPASYANFNEFFSRTLKSGARPLDDSPVVFPCDGRHLGFQKASEIENVFVKGQRFNLPALLGSKDLAEKYTEGTLVLSRLCPVDYHRFHFPTDCIPGEPQLINGPLYSVSPIALRKNLSYLWQNKRVLTKLETKDFGTILFLEIGATNVGSIKQTFHPGSDVRKGDEKGYFSFGGSSTLMLFEPNKVQLAPDLLEHSSNQTELYAKMGTVLANPR